MDFFSAIFFFIIIILSAIIHEYAHGWMAERLGDPTARLSGRLTLNPIAHIDPIGTILVPLVLLFSGTNFLFGWAKPVPYNPFNLRDKRWDPMWVALAGPGSNLIIAAVLSIMVRLSPGSAFIELVAMIVYINILLAVFNLMPVPPLDGSKVLYSLLPDSVKWLRVKIAMERYGMILVILFIFVFWQFVSPVVRFLFRLFVGG